ncbi:MAG: hypothetical protein ACLRT4_02060 [Thomasclavelia sp.]
MERCALCNKKIGGLNGRNKIINTNLEICHACYNKIEIMLTRLQNAKSPDELNERLEIVLKELNQYSTKDEYKNQIKRFLNNVYSSKKAEFTNKNISNKIIDSENDRKESITYSSKLIDKIINDRKENSNAASLTEINDQYEYDVYVVRDKIKGTIDIEKLKTVLLEYSVLGWRLKSVIPNVSSRNVTTVGSPPIGTIPYVRTEEIILIFERKISNAKR